LPSAVKFLRLFGASGGRPRPARAAATSPPTNTIESDPVSRRILYVLVWRNADERQFFAPYGGHSSAADFIEFYDNPYVLFEDGLPDLYR
jgi:hypothetical protein